MNNYSSVQLQEVQKKLRETSVAAEKVQEVLTKSAICITEAKESMVRALLENEVDLSIISQSTNISIDKIMEIHARIKKQDAK